MSESSEKGRFIKKHAAEILPLVPGEERPALKSGTFSKELIDDALEKYENKLFVHKNESAEEGAERVLMTTNDIGSYANAASFLTEKLLADPRCKELDVVTGGIADAKFQAAFGDEFTQIRNTDSFLKDLDAVLEEGPVDIALGTVSSRNGPESLVVYNGKQLLGAKKSFFIFEAWGTLGSSFNDTLLRQERESGAVTSAIDGFFCNDELAKEMIRRALPSYPPERIYVTGTPALDSLENEKADAYRTETRRKLGIRDDAFVALCLDSGLNNYPGADPKSDEKTLVQTYEALVEAARAHADRHIVLLYRPHPNNPEIPSELRARIGTSAVEILFGTAPFSMNEVTAASDIIMSSASTENMLAPFRGKRSAYLAYEGLGGAVLEHAYGPDIVRKMGEVKGVSVERTTEDVTRLLNKVISGKLKEEVSRYEGNATDKILNIVFNKKA